MAAAQAASEEKDKPLAQRLQAWPQQVRNYFDELRNEMRRVTWPSRKQVRATTLVVIATVFAFAVFFYFVDLLLARLITSIQIAFTK